MESQNYTRAINDNLMDIIFEKTNETPNTPEGQLLKHKKNLGIKVQSVVLPREHELFTLKTEPQVMNWLQNKVHNVNTAFYKINSKYTGDTERVNWNNNKMQNQRFLETKNLYKEKDI
jgi:hypothetical protein